MTPALNGVSFIIERGKMTALVGASGSGKSTTVKLLERYYDPMEGKILVQGQDLKAVNLKTYRKHVGYVGQEPVLFNESIKENILYCKPDAEDYEIEDALKSANAHFVFEKLQEGIYTNVGTSGSQLSGGEKQRIALARAFIKKPILLILDEATSALDRKNEEEV
jgi:ATP-binding cassette, subfamily B (MDR/TAP), member 1